MFEPCLEPMQPYTTMEWLVRVFGFYLCKEAALICNVFFLLQLEHMFKHRLNTSYRHAVEYVKQFPSPIISMIAKLVAYVTGAFAAILIGIALIDESLMEGHVRTRVCILYVSWCLGRSRLYQSLEWDVGTVPDPHCLLLNWEGILRGSWCLSTLAITCVLLEVLLRKLKQICAGQGLVQIRCICSEVPQGRALWILQGRNLE